MPITAIKFDDILPNDIHVVRGTSAAGQTSQDLRDLLRVTPAGGGNQTTYLDYLQSHNDVAILFTPLFKAQAETATEFQGFGIAVNKSTGRVTARGKAPATAPATFIVEATVTKNTGGPNGIPPAFLRVHVHQTVVRVTLTPKRLSTRRGARQRSHRGVACVHRPRGIRRWHRGPRDALGPGDVPAEDPLRRTVGEAAAVCSVGDVIPVTVTTSAQWGNRSDNGRDCGARYLGQRARTCPAAELIEGPPKVWDGAVRPESVPNVLVFGCGFTAADQAEFEKIVDGMVHLIRTDRMLQPYGHLATSMNFWRLMLPAAAPGVSIQCEVGQALVDGQLFAWDVPLPLVPPPALAAWQIQHLLYAVGLPVPADFALVKDAANHQPLPSPDALRAHDPATMDFSALFDKWTAVARPVPGVIFSDVTPRLAHQWLTLADRTFVDDVDIFPFVTVGEPPAAGRSTGGANLSNHPLRGSLEERDAFFKRVTAAPKPGFAPIALDGPPPQNAIGNLWITDPASRPAFTFDNRQFLVALNNIPYGRANARILTRLHLYFTGASGNQALITGIPVARVAGRSALTLALPAPTAAASDMATIQVVVHELTHTFDIGDEYDEAGAKYPGTEAELASAANLTTPGTFQNPDGSVRFGDIKWNWHRVRKASALTQKLKPAGGLVYHAYMRLASGFQFAVGDKVRLRKRERRKVIQRSPFTSAVAFTVKEVHKTNPDDPNDTQHMMLVLEAEGAVDVGPFDADSLIYLPVAAPPDLVAAGRPYLTLVSPAAERIMSDIGGLMNGKSCPPASARDTVPLKKDPLGKVADALLPHLVVCTSPA